MLVERFDQEIGGARFERVVSNLTIVDDGDHHNRNVDAVREPPNLLHELDAVEFGKLEIGEHHVYAVLARIFECAARRVEELEVELWVDLPHDLRDQQPAAEEIVDDENGVSLSARERELGDHARAGLGPKWYCRHVEFPW